MLPLIVCSIISSAVVLERFWSLQRSKITPESLLPLVWRWAKEGVLDTKRLDTIRKTSPLGRGLAAGLMCRDQDRLIMREAIEETGRHATFELNKYLNTLGTIASISPLLGLLGTVVGMIKVFNAITTQGVGDPSILASGISEALLTTAAGLCVAIPTLMFYRFFLGRVEGFVVHMEQEALKLVEMAQRERLRLGVSNLED